MDNFFQAPDGSMQQDVRAGNGELQLMLPWGSRSEVYADVGGTLYNEFDPSWNVTGGMLWRVGPHESQARLGYRARAPRIEVGDTLGFADVMHLGGSYRVRPVRALQIEALVDYFDEEYRSSPDKANTAFDLGGSLRYRGWDYMLSPEVGWSLGQRDVRADSEDFDQRSFWVTLRSVPAPFVYISVRYRDRLREYAIADQAASNYLREDRRRQWTLTVDVKLHPSLAWTAYFSLEDANSTKASRNFRTQYLWTGFTYQLR